MAEEKINKIANFKSLFENNNEETHNSATVKLQRSASKLNIPDIFKTKQIVSEEDNSNAEYSVKPNHEVIEISTKMLTEDKVKSMKNIFEKNNSTSNLNQTEENITEENIENDVKSKNKVKIFKSNQKINEDTNIDVNPENETVKIYKPKITGDKIKSIKDTFERSSTTITNQLETTEIQAHSSLIDNKNEDIILKNSRKSQSNEGISNNQVDNIKSINESIEIIPQKISEDKVRLIKSKFEKIKTNGNKIDIEQILDKETENVENKEKLSNVRSTNEDTQHVPKIEDMKTSPKNIGVDNVRNIKNKFEMGFSAEKSIQTPENVKNEVLEAKTLNEDSNPDIKTTNPIQDTIEVSTNEFTEDKTKVIKNIFEKSSPPSISIQNDQNSETVNNFLSKCDEVKTDENKNKLNFPVLRQLNLDNAPKKVKEQPDENFELSPRKLKSTNLTERSISQNFDFTKPKEVKLQRSLNDDSKINLRKVPSPENRNNAIVFDFTRSDLSPKGEMKSPIGNVETKLNLDKKELVSEVNDELIETSKISDDCKAEIPLNDTNDKDENFDLNESQIETKEINESLSNKVPVPRMRTKFFTKDEINTISLEDELPDL